MQPQNSSLPPQPPKRYWQDSKWAVSNIRMLTEKYANEWIAIYKKQVIVHSTDLNKVLNATQNQRLKNPLIKFIERGMHVYKYFAGVSDQL